MTLVDDSNFVVGHAAFYDHPNWSISESSHWMEWLQEHFESKKCDVRHSSLNFTFYLFPSLKIIIIPYEECVNFKQIYVCHLYHTNFLLLLCMVSLDWLK